MLVSIGHERRVEGVGYLHAKCDTRVESHGNHRRRMGGLQCIPQPVIHPCGIEGDAVEPGGYTVSVEQCIDAGWRDAVAIQIKLFSSRRDGRAGSLRSEERRGGKECIRTCRSWWLRVH